MADMIHNVRDTREGSTGRIDSVEVESLEYDSLTEADIGRTVVYQDSGRAWLGTLTSWRGGLVFARYTSGSTASGAHASDLKFKRD